MKSFGTIAMSAVWLLAGCTITATDHEHHDNRPVVVDNGGASTNNSDYDREPRHREEPRVVYREERHDDRPIHEEPRREEVVVWYREIPDRGNLDDYLPGFQGEFKLQRGVYHTRGGKIKFRDVPGGLKIIGSGTGDTIIVGDVDAKGNNFVFKDFSITGDLYLRGADCQVHVYVEGRKDVGGPRLNAQYHDRPYKEQPRPQPQQPRPQPQQPQPQQPVVVQPKPQPQQPQPQQPQPQPNNGKLANKGFLDNYLPQGFKGEVFLEPGIYKLRDGKIKFGGGGLIIHGAGKENTFIEGNMTFHGDGYVIDQLTIKGDVEVRGNNNFGDVGVRGNPDIRGGNNRGWGRVK